MVESCNVGPVCVVCVDVSMAWAATSLAESDKSVARLVTSNAGSDTFVARLVTFDAGSATSLVE
jgi:hypothetical protein